MKLNLVSGNNTSTELQLHGRTEVKYFETDLELPFRFDSIPDLGVNTAEEITKSIKTVRASTLRNSGKSMYGFFNENWNRFTVDESSITAKSPEQNARDWERRKQKTSGLIQSRPYNRTNRKETQSATQNSTEPTHEIISENGEVIDRVLVIGSQIAANSLGYSLGNIGEVLIDGEDYGLKLREIKKETSDLVSIYQSIYNLSKPVTLRSRVEIALGEINNSIQTQNPAYANRQIEALSWVDWRVEELEGTDCEDRFNLLYDFVKLQQSLVEKRVPKKLLEIKLKDFVSRKETELMNSSLPRNHSNETLEDHGYPAQTETQPEPMPEPHDFGLPEIEPYQNEPANENSTESQPEPITEPNNSPVTPESLLETLKNGEIQKPKKGSRKNKKG